MKLKTSIALTGFVAAFALLALTPAGASFVNTNNADSPVLFGMAEMTLKNGDGDIVASQTVHNDLVNTGEGMLIHGVFGDLPDAQKPHVICIAEDIAARIGETTTAAQFDLNASFSTTNTCIVASINFDDGGLATITSADDSASTAELNATFYGSDGGPGTRPANVITGAVINSIAICNAANDAADLVDCQSTGVLFSAVGVNRTPMGAADSVDVTYIFNLTSPTN